MMMIMMILMLIIKTIIIRIMAIKMLVQFEPLV